MTHSCYKTRGAHLNESKRKHRGQRFLPTFSLDQTGGAIGRYRCSVSHKKHIRYFIHGQKISSSKNDSQSHGDTHRHTHIETKQWEVTGFKPPTLTFFSLSKRKYIKRKKCDSRAACKRYWCVLNLPQCVVVFNRYHGRKVTCNTMQHAVGTSGNAFLSTPPYKSTKGWLVHLWRGRNTKRENKHPDSGVVPFTLTTCTRGGLALWCSLAYMWQKTWCNLSDVQSWVCRYEPAHSVPSPRPGSLTQKKSLNLWWTQLHNTNSPTDEEPRISNCQINLFLKKGKTPRQLNSLGIIRANAALGRQSRASWEQGWWGLYLNSGDELRACQSMESLRETKKKPSPRKTRGDGPRQTSVDDLSGMKVSLRKWKKRD